MSIKMAECSSDEKKSALEVVSSPVTLPCGAILRNRVCKSAMTEGLADEWNRSTPALERLYESWSHNGEGVDF